VLIRALADSLPIALGIALSPLPIAAVLIRLMTPRAWIVAPVFLAGWTLGIVVTGSAVLFAPDIRIDAATTDQTTRSSALFARWKLWLIRHHSVVTLVPLIAFGTFLVVRGLQVLTANG
jgi:hypothetical protein